jgi:hypothetical protein
LTKVTISTLAVLVLFFFSAKLAGENFFDQIGQLYQIRPQLFVHGKIFSLTKVTISTLAVHPPQDFYLVPFFFSAKLWGLKFFSLFSRMSPINKIKKLDHP